MQWNSRGPFYAQIYVQWGFQGPPKVPPGFHQGFPRVLPGSPQSPPRVPPLFASLRLFIRVWASLRLFCHVWAFLHLFRPGWTSLRILPCVKRSAPIWPCVDLSAPMSPCVRFSAHTYAPSYAHANIQTRCEVLLDRRARSRRHAAKRYTRRGREAAEY